MRCALRTGLDEHMPRTRRKSPPITLAPVLGVNSRGYEVVPDSRTFDIAEARLRDRFDAHERRARIVAANGAVASELPNAHRTFQARGAVEIGRAETVVDASRRDGVISQPRVRLSDDPWARIKASPKLHADPDMRRLLGEAGDRFAQDHWTAFGPDLSAMDPSREGGGGSTDGWFSSDHQVAAKNRWSKAVDALDAFAGVARFAVDAICIRGSSPVDVGKQIMPGSGYHREHAGVAIHTLSLGLARLAKHYGIVR
jgi:hypothetical protein